jgi:hypothetical protein
MKIHMDALQDQVSELETHKCKLVAEMERVKRKKKSNEDERELKTTRVVRSSSSNILLKERSRLKSR